MLLTISLNPAIDKIYDVDDFTVGGVFRPREMTATAGGKGLNVTRVARLLGEPVIATGFIGGNSGRFIEERVCDLGAEGRFVEIAGETRICVAVADRKNHTATEVLEPGPEITPGEQAAFLARYRSLLSSCGVVAASGSLPRGVPTSFYRELAETARGAGKTFILDASGAALREGLSGLPYMVKPNRDELEDLLGRPCATRSAMANALIDLKARGIILPVVTLGSDGCLAALPDGVYHFSAPPVETVNTVGSGDAFVAGVSVALARGCPPVEAVGLGMACGVANTKFFQTGMVSPDLVEKYRREIHSSKLTENKRPDEE